MLNFIAEVITERSRNGVGVWLFLPEPKLNFCIRAGVGFTNLVGVGVLITIVCSQSD